MASISTLRRRHLALQHNACLRDKFRRNFGTFL
jgi:hypothetical protein